MNETRKAIIELIEPYMNKTLSEGCLLIKNNGYTKVKYIELFEGNNIICLYNGILITELELNEGILNKIIGHYDITAVLKYVREKGYGYKDDGYSKIEIYSGEEFNPTIGRLNYKPLHLYTEEEDKNLLELLLKLK